jgi:hypothetical protein
VNVEFPRQAARTSHERPPRVFSQDDWRAFLVGELGGEIAVRYGRARHKVVRVVSQSGRRTVHLNAVFAEAPDEVRVAVARWIRAGRRARAATRTLDAWIETRLQLLEAERPARVALTTAGAVFDLAQIAAEVRAECFADEFGELRPWPRITWGRASTRQPRRSLRLGSFEATTRIVRIHPVLDQAAVPRFFVRYVMFHELLHAVLDEPPRGNGRRVHHGPQFRRRERAFADTERAFAWEREHIDALIRSARTGQPLSLGRAPRRRARPLASTATWLQRTLFD